MQRWADNRRTSEQFPPKRGDSLSRCEKSPDGVFVHIGRVSKGEIKEGQLFNAEVDKERGSYLKGASATTLFMLL